MKKHDFLAKKEKLIDFIETTDSSGIKESQLIAFRADFDSSKRIGALVKLMNISKTEVIKETIRNSFDSLLIRDTLQRMYTLIKKEFESAKIIYKGFDSHKIDEDETDLPLTFSFKEGQVLIELPKLEKKCNDKNIRSALTLLIIELKVEGLKTIKVELTKPLFIVDINKIDAQLLKELQVIALKNNLELKSSRQVKNNMQFEFKLDRMIDLHEKWLDLFEKDIKVIHESLKQISNFNCFKENITKKSKS